MYESDARHGGAANYVELVNVATAKHPEFREWCLETEGIPMARRVFHRIATVKEICRRLGVEGAGNGDGILTVSGRVTGAPAHATAAPPPPRNSRQCVDP